jgi:Arc/MetJ family transcription regulator
MSKRLQVVMAKAEYEEIEAAAAAARTTVSEWVRRALREARRVSQATEPKQPSGILSGPAGPDSGGAIIVRERTRAYGDLVEKVMEEYGLADEESAIRFALRRAADPPLGRDEILAMEGTGWEGDLDDLRRADDPEPLP